MRLSPDGLVVKELLYFGEEDGLFVVVVRLDKLVPRLGVAYEIRLVLVPHVGRLLIDAVVTAEDRVLEEAHVGCAGSEDVGQEFLYQEDYLFDAPNPTDRGEERDTCRLRFVLRRCEELHVPVSPRLGRGWLGVRHHVRSAWQEMSNQDGDC